MSVSKYLDSLDQYVWLLRCDVPGLGLAGQHLHVAINEPLREGAWFVAFLGDEPCLGRCRFVDGKFRLKMLDGALLEAVRETPAPGQCLAFGAVFMIGFLPDL